MHVACLYDIPSRSLYVKSRSCSKQIQCGKMKKVPVSSKLRFAGFHVTLCISFKPKCCLTKLASVIFLLQMNESNMLARVRSSFRNFLANNTNMRILAHGHDVLFDVIGG